MPSDDTKTVKLPDLGEGLTEAVVVELLVSPGDTVDMLQPVMVVETEKSVADVTSKWAGTVSEVHVEVDQWVEVGEDLVSLTVTS
ncbi:MAG: biotin/lipoyl-containing protein [Acidimicrobiales bacterium]